MREPVDFDSFLTDLRHAGVPVGPEELSRVGLVLERTEPLNRDRLRNVLRCILAKSEEHGRTFDRLFDAWCLDVPADETFREPQPRSAVARLVRPMARRLDRDRRTAGDTANDPAAAQRFRPSRRAILGGAIGLGLTIGLSWLVVSSFITRNDAGGRETVRPVERDTEPGVEMPVSPPKPDEVAVQPLKIVPHTWVPEFKVTPPSKSSMILTQVFALGLLGLASLFGAGHLLRRYRRGALLPPREPIDEEGAAPHPRVRIDDPDGLLTADERRNIVWGVEHYVAEETTDRIDVDATVAATARAGVPVIRQEHPRFPREVQLWRDRAAAADDPTVDDLESDIAHSLEEAGLPVHRITFDGIPDRLVDSNRRPMMATDLERHRETSIVAILTDGVGLREADTGADTRPALEQVLRSFAEWPRLAFVDFSRHHGLRARLERYRLRCLSPEDVPQLLGGHEGRTEPVAAPSLDRHGDLRVWAAAACLDPDPIDRATATALAESLDLDLPRFSFQELLREGREVRSAVDWAATKRHRLVNWLAGGQRQWKDGVLDPNTRLARALTFWRGRRAEERARNDTESVRIEEALLQLWEDPRRGTRTLYRLFRDPQIDVVRHRLRCLAPQDWHSLACASIEHLDDEMVFLPWCFDSSRLGDVERVMLWEMEFGRRLGQPPEHVRMPGSAALAIGFLMIVGLIAGFSAWQTWQTPRPPRIRPSKASFAHPTFEAIALHDVVRTGAETFALRSGTPKFPVVLSNIPADAEVIVSWRWKPVARLSEDDAEDTWDHPIWPYGARVFDNARIVRYAELAYPIRCGEADWPRRSLVAIEAESLSELDTAGLDQGGVDAVLVARRLADVTAEQWRLFFGPRELTRDDQLLVRSLSKIENLPFAGDVGWASGVDRPIRTVQGRGFRRYTGPPERVHPETGWTFVKVYGGTFMMGSPEDDDQASSHEHPRVPVTISPFWIAKYEAVNPETSSGARLPWGDVSWNEVQTWLGRFDGDLGLPTEAQWEYAARGGQARRWSFGDDVAALAHYANNGFDVLRVGGRAPNPLGLHDVHGNVDEWCRDEFDTEIYQAWRTRHDAGELLVDPFRKSEGPAPLRAVLRGGSFFVGSRVLRSACRVGFEPELSDRVFGFRCVWSPRRRP